jgi:hypothetical protein
LRDITIDVPFSIASISSQEATPGFLVAYRHGRVRLPDDRFAIPRKPAVLIGRSDDNDVVIQDDTVSRRHCFIEIKQGIFIIRDLMSHNGTWVNGEKVSPRAPLSNGTVVRIGQSVLVFYSDIVPMLRPCNSCFLGPFHAAGIVDDICSACCSGDHVLVEGESGVGKEIAAELIRDRVAEQHPEAPFVPHNAADFGSEDEAVTTLYGVAGGAYTGVKARDGLLKIAKDGILYIDEAHQYPPRVQASLLRGIETGVFRRPGETIGRKIPVRLVLATNNPQGLLHDLYQRLCRVEIPPLNARRADIPAIFNHLLVMATEGIGWETEGILGLLNSNHYETMCLADYTGSNARKLLRLARLLSGALRRGMDPDAAVFNLFSAFFKKKFVEASRYGKPKDAMRKTPPDNPSLDAQRSKYVKHRKLIESLYIETGGKISETARELEKRGIKVSARWLGEFIKRWGLPAKRLKGKPT